MSGTRGILRYPIMVAFLWLNMVLLGALVFETAVLYPNFFHDVPRSLSVSSQFMSVGGPAGFFRPLGAATVLVDLAALAVVWPRPRARNWAAASLLVLIAGNFLFSALYFWPRNTIMFTEGPSMHPAAYLQAVADGFVGWNRLRLTADVLAAVCAFVAFLASTRTPGTGSTPVPGRGEGDPVTLPASGEIR